MKIATPASAQQASSREYFVAHTQGLGAPSQLSRGDAEYYRDVFEAIEAHGRETYPHECCGALFGRDGRLLRANPSLAAFCALPESELPRVKANLARRGAAG